MKHIALIESQELYRKSLKLILESYRNTKVVYESRYSMDILDTCINLHLDLALIEFCAENKNVFTLVQRLRRQHPQIKILVVGESQYHHFLSAWMKYDLDGLITKDVSSLELQTAIDSVFNGNKYIQASVAKHFVHDYIAKKNNNQFKKLSKRELQITWMIVCGLTISEIAKLLYLSQKTITSYHRRIFDKIKIKNDVELIHAVLKTNENSVELAYQMV